MALTENDPIWPFFKVTAEIQSAYRNTFNPRVPGAATVLADLARLCFAFAPANTKREQGMRQVWLHIQKRLLLSDAELTAILAQLPPEQRASMFDRAPFHFSPR